MTKFFRSLIFYFALLSFVIGLIQIVIGQLDYNSIFEGIKLSYNYFVIGFIMIALDLIIDYLEQISMKS